MKHKPLNKSAYAVIAIAAKSAEEDTGRQAGQHAIASGASRCRWSRSPGTMLSRIIIPFSLYLYLSFLVLLVPPVTKIFLLVRSAKASIFLFPV